LPSSPITTTKKRIAKLTLWPLVAATFSCVRGTYGTEEIYSWRGDTAWDFDFVFLPCCGFADGVHDRRAFERAAAEGGYYAWVRRGLEILGISGSVAVAGGKYF